MCSKKYIAIFIMRKVEKMMQILVFGDSITYGLKSSFWST